MILGIEIALFILGIVVLSRGVYTVSKTKKVRGGRARILGVLCMLPLPLAFGAGFIYGLVAVAQGTQPNRGAATAIELAVIVAFVILIVVLGSRFYKRQEAEQAGMAAQGGWPPPTARRIDGAPPAGQA